MTDSSSVPKHRRLGSRGMPPLPSFLDDSGPKSTSKALLVSAIAPCKCFTRRKIVEEQQLPTVLSEDNVKPFTASSSSSSAKRKDSASSSTAGGVAVMKENQLEEEQEGEDENQTQSSDGGDSDDGGDDAVPIREEVMTKSTENESQEITMEEASAVKRGQDLDAEIDVEELLRIVFQKLLDEYYLLNVPTFSRVEDKKVIQVDPNLLNGDKINGEPTAWIRVEAMALPSSLGIILDRLERIGVGTLVGTVSVYKVELCRTASPYLTLPPPEKKESGVSTDSSNSRNNKDATTETATLRGFDATNVEEPNSVENSEEKVNERLIQEARNEWKNAATRLRIEQVREQIGEQAALSFDFLALLTIAGILAGIGLMTNNTVVIVASMLVSPIMGPVLGLTFGTRVRDWSLVMGSFINETLALTVCLLIGILLGITTGFTNLAHETWPTNEMEIRGEPAGLVTGIAVAIPSGAGVCLSILGGNTSSLVGVAISASLLPPAVNAGICFMHAILLKLDAVTCLSGTTAQEFAVIGAISFALTVINILCIWVAGIVMFQIKEVSPTENKGAFWARDIKVARELNEKGNKGGEKAPPVDVSVVLNGVRSALSRQKSDHTKPIKTVKLKPPRVGRTFSQANLNSAFAFHPQPRRRKSETYFWWERVGQNDNQTIPEEEDAAYVNLEEVAALLGFGGEDDDDDVIDPSMIIRWGRGRYI